MAIARARSADMATKHYFSHTQPDGRNVFDILSAQKITWYGAGEIIAWNNYPTLETSIAAANTPVDELAGPQGDRRLDALQLRRRRPRDRRIERQEASGPPST